jgi:hypothetical protein
MKDSSREPLSLTCHDAANAGNRFRRLANCLQTSEIDFGAAASFTKNLPLLIANCGGFSFCLIVPPRRGGSRKLRQHKRRVHNRKNREVVLSF